MDWKIPTTTTNTTTTRTPLDTISTTTTLVLDVRFDAAFLTLTTTSTFLNRIQPHQNLRRITPTPRQGTPKETCPPHPRPKKNGRRRVGGRSRLLRCACRLLEREDGIWEDGNSDVSLSLSLSLFGSLPPCSCFLEFDFDTFCFVFAPSSSNGCWFHALNRRRLRLSPFAFHDRPSTLTLARRLGPTPLSNPNLNPRWTGGLDV